MLQKYQWEPIVHSQSGLLYGWWRVKKRRALFQSQERFHELLTLAKPFWSEKSLPGTGPILTAPPERPLEQAWALARPNFDQLDLGPLVQPPVWLLLPTAWWKAVPQDPRTKQWCRNFVQLCHGRGIKLLAREVGQRADWGLLLELGVDLVQGEALSHGPWTADGRNLTVDNWKSELTRRTPSNPSLLTPHIQVVPPIASDWTMDQVLDHFKQYPNLAFFPVLDAAAQPLGVVLEEDLKAYVFSPFGKDLLKNRSLGKKLAYFIHPLTAADIHWPVETLVEIHNQQSHQSGVVITQDGRYCGVLGAIQLLHIVHEDNMALARDANPLSRLPGNQSIQRWLERLLDTPQQFAAVAYFDLDHFKAFNDKFGFRIGDRAILMLAEGLGQAVHTVGAEVGHIGGDDFVVVWSAGEDKTAFWSQWVGEALDTFRRNARAFFGEAEQQTGWYWGHDRYGQGFEVPLLGASAAVLLFQPGQRPENLEVLTTAIGDLKAEAKRRAGQAVATWPLD